MRNEEFRDFVIWDFLYVELGDSVRPYLRTHLCQLYW